ncbi:ABC transporter substrate-binding protein [Ensifer sp. SL37]|uniref:ABC transporter substrate-binding protein n=1 Tax=Ensifer sp. SL37 TaxID=2995137 RepID=UPI002276EBE8|nr:ABC transporter substrate-binding protein [Ensifer sp. SL37]MCY1746288.1 ABC transporter substrate-binding protein [Ensifer sp. SL37]
MAIAAVLRPAETAIAQSRKITIRVGHFPNITHVQALIARGFERRGQSWFTSRLGPNAVIEWYAYNAGPSAMEAIFAGSLDLAYVGPNPAINAYARSAGAEIRIVAGAVNGGSALVVQPDEGLASPRDFVGKRIGTPQFGNTQDVSARAWLRDGGLRITQSGGDAHVVPTANPEQLSLFKTRQLDAVWTVEPWVSRLELEAAGKILIEERQAITTVLVARAAFLAQHRDLVHRFVEAHRELGTWISQHPKEAQAMVRDELKADFRVTMPPELISRAWPRMTVTGDINLSALQVYVAKAQRVGFLTTIPDLSALVDSP